MADFFHCVTKNRIFLELILGMVKIISQTIKMLYHLIYPVQETLDVC